MAPSDPQLELQDGTGSVIGAVYVDSNGNLSLYSPNGNPQIDGSNLDLDSNDIINVNGVDPNSALIASELGLPSYSDTADAPQSARRIVYVNGSGSQAEGLYRYDSGSAGYVRVGVDTTLDPTLTTQSTGNIGLQDNTVHWLGVPVPNNKTLEIYRWGAWDDTETSTTGLNVVWAKGDRVIQNTENTMDTIGSKSSPLYSATNGSGSFSTWYVGVENATGSTYDPSNGKWVTAHFSYRTI